MTSIPHIKLTDPRGHKIIILNPKTNIMMITTHKVSTGICIIHLINGSVIEVIETLKQIEELLLC